MWWSYVERKHIKSVHRKFGVKITYSKERKKLGTVGPHSLIKKRNCKAVLTDSGGIQEETTFLGAPCITIRKNTETPHSL